MSESAEVLIELRNDVTELERLSEEVDGFCAAHAVSPKIAFNLNLVLEEVVVNVINYAFPDASPQPIYVHLYFDGERIGCEVRDTGVAFDPLVVGPPDFELDLDKRVVGGLGVHFLKTLMDETSYRRRDGQNCLRFSKRVAGSDT